MIYNTDSSVHMRYAQLCECQFWVVILKVWWFYSVPCGYTSIVGFIILLGGQWNFGFPSTFVSMWQSSTSSSLLSFTASLLHLQRCLSTSLEWTSSSVETQWLYAALSFTVLLLAPLTTLEPFCLFVTDVDSVVQVPLPWELEWDEDSLSLHVEFSSCSWLSPQAPIWSCTSSDVFVCSLTLVACNSFPLAAKEELRERLTVSSLSTASLLLSG